MALGFALVIGAIICGLIVVCGGLWLARSVQTGEFGASGSGLTPSIRRARQPGKFWLAILMLAVFLILPLAFVLFVVFQVFA